jgi:hypothetical protein
MILSAIIKSVNLYLTKELKEIKKSRGVMEDIELRSRDIRTTEEKVNYYIDTNESKEIPTVRVFIYSSRIIT